MAQINQENYMEVIPTVTICAPSRASHRLRMGFAASRTNFIAAAGALLLAAGFSAPAAASAGTLQYSTAAYNTAYNAGPLIVTVERIGGTTGAVRVGVNTHAGTALNGLDFTGVNQWVRWAAGDGAPKTVSIKILNRGAFKGSRSFSLGLSGESGATLSSPATAVVNISGTSMPPCAQASNAWVTTGIFDSKQYGDYVLNNNNWGGTPGQTLWANSASCWGVTTTATVDVDTPRSYPSITRGWTQNGTVMQALSTPGTYDWTTKSGMGILVTQLTKAKIHWSFSAPTTSGLRWMALQDIYFHTVPTPPYALFPPEVDLLIDQALGDQVVNSSTYYALVSQGAHATTVTVGGDEYLIYVDLPAGLYYHQPGGHEVHMFNLPTAFTSDNADPLWGTMDNVKDLTPIVKYLMQSNPLDDAGQPLRNAAGEVITTPLITANLYLTAINSGWEIDTGTSFTTTGYCIAMQGEPDCP